MRRIIHLNEKDSLFHFNTFFTSCSEHESIPSSLMNFEEIAVPDTWNVHNVAGFLGSGQLNSLFIASRKANPETQMLGERLLRYDLDDGV